MVGERGSDAVDKSRSVLIVLAARRKALFVFAMCISKALFLLLYIHLFQLTLTYTTIVHHHRINELLNNVNKN